MKKYLGTQGDIKDIRINKGLKLIFSKILKNSLKINTIHIKLSGKLYRVIHII